MKLDGKRQRALNCIFTFRFKMNESAIWFFIRSIIVTLFMYRCEIVSIVCIIFICILIIFNNVVFQLIPNIFIEKYIFWRKNGLFCPHISNIYCHLPHWFLLPLIIEKEAWLQRYVHLWYFLLKLQALPFGYVWFY